MEELRKIRRVIERKEPSAPHEVLLVLDATTGQNALTQAQAFTEAVEVTSVCLTKLDGTSKGGIVFAVCDQLGIPVRFVGTGEGAGDPAPFSSCAAPCPTAATPSRRRSRCCWSATSSGSATSSTSCPTARAGSGWWCSSSSASPRSSSGPAATPWPPSRASPGG